MRKFIDLVENTLGQNMPRSLFHATNESNVGSISRHGLQRKYFGNVHGRTDFSPPEPCIYLATNHMSNNLNTELFARGPVVVLEIDMAGLDPNAFYPDDAMAYAFAEEDILQTARSVQMALGCDAEEAKKLFLSLENAADDQIIGLLKPFWSWWLRHAQGGEVAYAADIPVDAIIGMEPYNA